MILNNLMQLNGDAISLKIENNNIIEISANEILGSDNIQVIDFQFEYFVSSGWIDIHTHCCDWFDLYGDTPDQIGYLSGVTTIVDAGTCGVNNIDVLYEKRREYKTNIYAFLNISNNGITQQNELENLEQINLKSIELKLKQYEKSKFLLGLKLRLSKSVVVNNDCLPLELIKTHDFEDKPRLMVHVGNAPPKLEDITKQLDCGDIITHTYNPKQNGVVTPDNCIKNCAIKARDKGILFDVGHGTESFSFETAKIAANNNLKANFISSDIYRKNRVNGPVYSLAQVMSKMLLCGYTLVEVVDAVTKSPAKALGLNRCGSLVVGNIGELTVFKVTTELKSYVDSTGKEKCSNQHIKPVGVVINNEYINI